MPAPKGHKPYPGCEKGGRPKKWTAELIEKEADAFEQWMQHPDSIWYEDFALERGYLPDNFVRWSKEVDQRCNISMSLNLEKYVQNILTRRRRSSPDRSTRSPLGSMSSSRARQRAGKMGIHLIAVPKVDVIPGIDTARSILNRCWFDERRCSQGVKCLENYKKEWNDRAGCWASKPLHNQFSHGADAFRTLATGMHLITGNQQVDTRTLGSRSNMNPYDPRQWHPMHGARF